MYVATYFGNVTKIIRGAGVTRSKLPAPDTGFGNPSSVAVDPTTRNVYFTATATNKIIKIPGGTGTPVAIGSNFSTPKGGAFANGDCYVADTGNNAVKKIPGCAGTTTVTLGSGFSEPHGVAVHAPSGDVFVADFGNRAVKKIVGGTGAVVSLPDGAGFGAPAYPDLNLPANGPTGVAVAGNGDVFVADFANIAILMISGTGTAAPLPIGSGFTVPFGVAVAC